MAKKSSKLMLEELLTLLAEALCNAIRDGVKVLDKEGGVHTVPAPAAIFREARELLKDNNIQALDVPGSPVHNLIHGLPFGEEQIAAMNADDTQH